MRGPRTNGWALSLAQIKGIKKTLSTIWNTICFITLQMLYDVQYRWLCLHYVHLSWGLKQYWLLGHFQYGGVYILVYSIGRYSIRCAQPSRCWRNGPEGLQSTWMIRTPPPPVCLADWIDLVSGIKSLKIALKLGNLGQNQVKLNFKDRCPSWGRLTTLRFLIALYRAGWAVIQLQSHYYKLRIILSHYIRERIK